MNICEGLCYALFFKLATLMVGASTWFLLAENEYRSFFAEM